MRGCVASESFLHLTTRSRRLDVVNSVYLEFHPKHLRSEYPNQRPLL